jgi:hypothetical protein
MIIKLGPWEPDSAGVDSGVMSVARNVYPTKTGYAPIRELSATTQNALAATCVGLVSVRTTAGGVVTFAGTRTKLYRLVAGNWVDYTRAAGGDYNVPVDEYWSFRVFGTTLIAVNINDDPQYIDVDAGTTNFAALGGSPPRARYVNVVGSFVVLASLSTDNNAVRNSAIEDPEGWTVGTNLCDEQTFPDGGRVTGIAGGEFGYVAQEGAIRRMIFQPGNDIAFRYERVESEHGCAAGYGLASTANTIFFPASDGFYSFGANGLIPIGGQRINKWFQSNSDTTRNFAVIAFTDPYAPRIGWAFYASSGSIVLDRILFYDWQIDKWTYSDATAQFWASMTTSGVTLEELDDYGDIDSGDIPYPFDSRVWEGGVPVIGAVSATGMLSFLEGTSFQTATLNFAPMHLNPGGRAKVQAIEPLGTFNDATVTLRVGRREKTQSSPSYTDATSLSSLSGIARFNASGRIHDLEMTVTQSTGTPWTHAQGLDLTAAEDGRK